MREKIHETERLYTSRCDVDLADEAISIYGDSDVMKYIMEPITDIESVRAELMRRIRRDLKFTDGLGSWFLFEKETDELIGNIMLKPIGWFGEHEEIEIGWHLRKKSWGKGYAPEMATELLNVGLYDLKLEEIYAIVKPANVSSKRVCEKLGMNELEQTNKFFDMTLDLYLTTPDTFPINLRR